jgi:hypothetical protein
VVEFLCFETGVPQTTHIPSNIVGCKHSSINPMDNVILSDSWILGFILLDLSNPVAGERIETVSSFLVDEHDSAVVPVTPSTSLLFDSLHFFEASFAARRSFKLTTVVDDEVSVDFTDFAASSNLLLSTTEDVVVLIDPGWALRRRFGLLCTGAVVAAARAALRFSPLLLLRQAKATVSPFRTTDPSPTVQ